MTKWMWVGVSVLLAIQAPLSAAVIYGGDTGNTTAPTDDPGWGRVGRCGSTTNGNSGIYMGNGWVLTANHGYSKTSFTVDGDKTYALIAGSGQQVGSADLYLYRVVVEAGDALASYGFMPIASSAPTSGTVTHIGTGVGQTDSSTEDNYWYKNETWYTSKPTGISTACVGYTWDALATRDTRWDYEYATSISVGEGYFATAFLAQDDYGMVTDKDSGSPLFVKNGDTWELAGAAASVGYVGATSMPDSTTYVTSSGPTIYGVSVYVDVTDYASTIESIIQTPEPATMALLLAGSLALLGRRRRQA